MAFLVLGLVREWHLAWNVNNQKVRKSLESYFFCGWPL